MEHLDERIERAVGSRPVRYTARAGGYSTAERYAVELADGRSVFVKSSDAQNLAEWIRREHEVYSTVEGPFMPRLEGFDDDGVQPVLAIEDLSDADWSVRWDDARVEAVREALAGIAASPHPPNTPRARDAYPDLWTRWQVVAADPAPFLGLGLRDERWLERALPEILAAVERAPVDGEDLCHVDIRSDNLCFRDGRAIVVDWNWTCRANAEVDIVAWAPSLTIEGGPSPWEMLHGAGEHAAFVAGVWAATAGLPPPETAPTVRAVQRQQLAVALDWLDRDLL